jgi:hypothetical protein
MPQQHLGSLSPSGQIPSGESVDPAAFAGWSASEEGRRFTTMSSQAWCDASVAAGTDRAAAAAAATRTTAFYTGAPATESAGP